MKPILLILFLLLNWSIQAQQLYIKTFGKKGDTPLIFLHGGPGYNAASFETSTAEVLAKKGFFVVIYDRRGEGRSTDTKAAYTFEEGTKDLKKICAKLKLKKVNLLGHSFGGMMAIEYAKRYPKQIENLILIGAPLNLQTSFKTIIDSSKAIYTQRKDNTNLGYISMLENMDTSTIQYSSYCFMHAMQNGFYSPKKLSEKALSIYKSLSTNDTFAQYASKMTQEPVKGFWKNEHYTTLDMTEDIVKLINNKISCFGLYGKEDGLYSSQQIEELKNLIGTKNVRYLDNCSHSVFIDQQALFIESIINWTKK